MFFLTDEGYDYNSEVIRMLDYVLSKILINVQKT